MAEANQTKKDELDRQAMEVGEQALALFRQFTREEISVMELQTRLRELDPATIMARYWDLLTSEAESVHCFEVLQLLNSLEEEMQYQVQRYGENSLWDDLSELQIAVGRVKRANQSRGEEGQ